LIGEVAHLRAPPGMHMGQAWHKGGGINSAWHESGFGGRKYGQQTTAVFFGNIALSLFKTRGVRLPIAAGLLAFWT